MQFRTKARAVDLLGKGQIADLPTAITELWKNGYDAYADNLTAEIYLKGYKGLESPLFVMTDDGKGMSRRDIFEKWLVLGTDSKSRAVLEERESEETLWKKPRIKSGEKGIGRLSVAFLGNPMLMLTKKQGHPLQALFIDWRLLENYDLFIEDVDIPIESINNLEEFILKFERLKESFANNFGGENSDEKKQIWDKSSKLKNQIEVSLKNSKLPSFLIKKLLKNLIETQNDHGTRFIIFEPNEQIIALTDHDEDGLDDRHFLLSSLSGLTNDFIENNKIVKTSFPVFKKNVAEFDLLTSQGLFFTAKDYDLADVIINGVFNGLGSFQGTIKIYDTEFPYTYTNPRKKDQRNNYGAFPLKIGVSQGIESESKLSRDAWSRINTKVSNNGGLYIYRDNFRVLPYGRTDFDFLGFEKRRAKRAGSYYFSHRRMFGYIALTRDKNKRLEDKSSREGLINNSAYRAFKNDLKSFFIELAREFFGTDANQSIFIDKKSETKNQKEVIKKDKKREIEAKKAFTRSLSEYPKKLVKYQIEYKKLLKQLEDKTKTIFIIYSDIEDILDRIHELDIEFKNLLPKIPKRYKPTETQLDRLGKYETKLIQFIETTKKNSEQLMLKVKEKLEIKELKIEFTKNYQKYNGVLEKIVSENRELLKSSYNKLQKDFSFRSRRIIDDLNFDKEKIIDSIDSKEKVLLHGEKIKEKFEFLRGQISKELTPLVEHLNKLSFDIDEELVQGAYKAEYETIKYEWAQTKETAQLGIAVEIIDHEFNQLYAQINHVLSKLKVNNVFKSENDFQSLHRYFKQLEDKYALLSPLYRVSGVVAKDISGQQIYEYLLKFFTRRIADYQIQFEVTTAFREHIIKIKEPVIHTVYINIINNAIYWMRNKEFRQILLDYNPKTEEIIICNSGFKIEEHRLEKIFGLFYSNRPNGRGIGLYLAKQSLNEAYLDIYATNDKEYNVLKGACFVIKPLK